MTPSSAPPVARDLIQELTGSANDHDQMSAAELELVVGELRRARVYLEYGMGESTRLAVREGAQKIFCAESDPEWIQRALHDRQLSELMRAGRLLICQTELGELGKWGWPLTYSHVRNWPSYSAAIWSRVNEPVDLVLVDGRFRVACILSTIMFAGAGQRLIVHDFWNRPAYHVVLPYLDVLSAVDSMGLFQVKRDLPLNEVIGLYARYANALI